MATFHQNLLQSFKNFRDKYLKANNTIFQFSYDTTTGKYGYKDANGNFVPFRTVQASKTVTAGTSNTTVTPDSGYDGVAEVTVQPTPSTSITPSNSSPASMSSGTLYQPSSSGYAISSYSSVSPSSSGAYFSSGMTKMSGSGYAYSSRPSQQSGYMSTYATLWTNPNPSTNFSAQTVSWSSYNLTNYTGSRYYIRITWRRIMSDSTTNSVLMSVSDFIRTPSTSSGVNPALFIGQRGSEYPTVRRIAYTSGTSVYIGANTRVGGSDSGSNGNIPTTIELVAIYPS